MEKKSYWRLEIEGVKIEFFRLGVTGALETAETNN